MAVRARLRRAGDQSQQPTVLKRFAPESPGIAKLVVIDADGQELGSEEVAIRYAGIPIYGIIVMVLAGILLFGGAGTSLVIALRRIQ